MQKEQMEPVSLEGTKLFSYFRSSASWRVRIILNLKKIDYEIIPVHLLKDHQNSNFYKTLNPQGLLPALYIDGKTLVESMAMAEYLEETRKRKFLKKKFPEKKNNYFFQKNQKISKNFFNEMKKNC